MANVVLNDSKLILLAYVLIYINCTCTYTHKMLFIYALLYSHRKLHGGHKFIIFSFYDRLDIHTVTAENLISTPNYYNNYSVVTK